ncbi:MAG: PAS domain S-box protein [Spirulina sp. SIO3F2]|nr:PAS domain S-box protein [Spirulina sp. SIO3F2]
MLPPALQLLDTLPHGIWFADRQGRLTWVNRHWQDHTGISMATAQAKVWWHWLESTEQEKIEDIWQQAQVEEKPLSTVLNWHDRHGQSQTTLLRIEPYTTALGQLVGWLGSLTPAPELDQAETRLLESEERHQILTDRSSDLIYSYAPDGICQYASPACKTLLGYEPKSLVGQSVFELWHPEDVSSLELAYGSLANLPDNYTHNYRIRRHDDTYIWFETTNRTYFEPDGETIREVIAIARDITERKQAELKLFQLNQDLEQQVSERENQLQTINRLYRSVLTSIEEVIFQTDTTGRWVFLSAPWKTITGYDTEESLNHSCLDSVFSQADRDYLAELLQKLWADDQDSFEYAFRSPTKNGTFRWLEMYAQRNLDSEGHLLGTSGAINDITERKQTEAVLKARAEELDRQREQIKRQNQELLQASRLKSQFLATISHELRTPMNAIMGFSQMLMVKQSGPLTPRQADMVERIFLNSQNLLTLLNEVLDFSKIEAGYWEVKLESLDLTRLVRLTVEELRSLAQKKNLALNVEILLKNPQVVSDRNSIRRLLVNLLSNAIKFTEKGGVTVTVKEVGSHEIVLTVQDTGVGIAPEHHDLIFEAFRQADQTLKRKHSGTGLGLAIVKSLTQMLNSTITVESDLGQGTAFRLVMPRYGAKPEAAEAMALWPAAP